MWTVNAMAAKLGLPPMTTIAEEELCFDGCRGERRRDESLQDISSPSSGDLAMHHPQLSLTAELCFVKARLQHKLLSQISGH